MTNIKNSLFIFILFYFNLIYSEARQEKPSVKALIEYIVDNQKKKYNS